MPKASRSANQAKKPLTADEKLAVAMLVNRGRPAAQIARQLGISAAKAELWAKKYRNAEAEGRLVFFEDDEGAVRPEADADLDPPVPMTGRCQPFFPLIYKVLHLCFLRGSAPSAFGGFPRGFLGPQRCSLWRAVG
ncbi:MAG: helix-turn-helix domain-containing protein, partial [Sutterella parvirubra]|nr:helix-turn-helix domain-containing protein [Sutterella parvirubra]